MERHPEHPAEHHATDVTPASVADDTYVTISDAARMTGASRTRLYRYIDSGKIERTADGKLSLQSLLSAGFDLKEQQATARPSDHLSYLLTHYTDMARQLNDSLEDQLEALREQLRFAHEQLRQAQQREAQLWLLLQPGQATAVPASGTRTEPQDASPQTHRIALAEEPAEPAPTAELLATAPEPSAAAKLSGQAEPEARTPQAGSFFSRWNR